MKEKLSIENAEQQSFESLPVDRSFYDKLKNIHEAERFLNWFKDKRQELSSEIDRLEKEFENNPLLSEVNKKSNESLRLDQRLFNELDWEKDVKEKKEIEEKMDLLSREIDEIKFSNPEIKKAVEFYNDAHNKKSDELRKFYNLYEPVATAVENKLLPFLANISEEKEKLKGLEKIRDTKVLTEEINGLYNQLELVLGNNQDEEQKIESLISQKEYEIEKLPGKIKRLEEAIKDNEERLANWKPSVRN
jgi:hypothetical protein